MPNYNFKCEKCDKNFDLFLKIDDRNNEKSPHRRCPYCGSPNLERQITPNAGILGGQSVQPTRSVCGQGDCGGGSCPFSNE